MGSAVPMGVLAAIAVRRYAQESKIAKFVLEEDVRRDSAAPSSDPDELVEPLLEGNAEAWQQFVLSQHRRIYSMCYRFSGDAANAEDVTQEVFLKIYRDLKSYDPAKHNLAEWITTITRNLLVDMYRRARSRLQQENDVLESSVTPAPSVTTPNREMLERVREAISRLPREISEAVVLHDIEAMGVDEISQIAKVSAKTVRRRLSIGRVKLAQLLQDVREGAPESASSDVAATGAPTSEERVIPEMEVAQAKILRRAIEVIGSEAEAMRWMGTPVRALDYATPVSLLHNSKGFEAVRLVLGRLEHGIL